MTNSEVPNFEKKTDSGEPDVGLGKHTYDKDVEEQKHEVIGSITDINGFQHDMEEKDKERDKTN